MAFGAYLKLCALDGLGIAVLQSILKARFMSSRNEQMGSMIIVSTKDHKVDFRELEWYISQLYYFKNCFSVPKAGR